MKKLFSILRIRFYKYCMRNAYIKYYEQWEKCKNKTKVSETDSYLLSKYRYEFDSAYKRIKEIDPNYDGSFV